VDCVDPAGNSCRYIIGFVIYTTCRNNDGVGVYNMYIQSLVLLRPSPRPGSGNRDSSSDRREKRRPEREARSSLTGQPTER
jgi:hypothetical protein